MIVSRYSFGSVSVHTISLELPDATPPDFTVLLSPLLSISSVFVVSIFSTVFLEVKPLQAFPITTCRGRKLTFFFIFASTPAHRCVPELRVGIVIIAVLSMIVCHSSSVLFGGPKHLLDILHGLQSHHLVRAPFMATSSPCIPRRSRCRWKEPLPRHRPAGRPCDRNRSPFLRSHCGGLCHHLLCHGVRFHNVLRPKRIKVSPKFGTLVCP